MGAVAEANRGGCARNLFLCDDMLEITEPETAPLLFDRDAVEAKLAHLGP